MGLRKKNNEGGREGVREEFVIFMKAIHWLPLEGLTETMNQVKIACSMA
jgi:hypothetical protein